MGEGWGEGDHPDSCAPTPLTRLKHPCYIIPQARQPTSSLIRKGSRSPMSRYSLHRARRTRAVWDRTATGTRLLPLSFPNPVSLPSPLDPPRMYLKTSAPSRPTSPQRHNVADARVPSPRMITHGSYPMRACPTTVDARVLFADDFPLRLHWRRCGCPRFIADDFPLRLHWRRCGCPRFIADDFPLRPHRRRCGCLRLPADDFPRPVPGRRGSAGNPHPHPVPHLVPLLSQLRRLPNRPHPHLIPPQLNTLPPVGEIGRSPWSGGRCLPDPSNMSGAESCIHPTSPPLAPPDTPAYHCIHV